MNYVIETQKLTKNFGQTTAIEDVDLKVAEGSIFAFLGPNGAGKTTTIKTMMNILPATRGMSKVMGTDSRQLGSREFQQIGYVSENQQILESMSVHDYISYCRSMYPTWNDPFCENLIKQFDLPLDKKISKLSRGMKMKTALVSSLAYFPKLIILDEPFSGLDLLVREEFINGILEVAGEQKWTIFISSHDIDEVERLADWVGIIDKGRLKLTEETESLQKRFKQIDIILLEEPNGQLTFPENWILPHHEGRAISFFESQYQKEETEKIINDLFPKVFSIEVKGMTLREIFLILAKQFKILNI